MRTDYLTLRHAAALAGLSPKTIYELCREGVIRARTARGRWRAYRKVFTNWWASGPALRVPGQLRAVAD